MTNYDAKVLWCPNLPFILDVHVLNLSKVAVVLSN